ncbi:hypothetical protein BD413DRAFT_471858 [Trametes elegans]|nr:hypothetical protein BD413DRAFT_471858 [Trametes elegans]
MSGMDEVTYLAAKSMGADEVTTQQIATAFSLLHVLQVYTASMMAVSVYDWLVCLKDEWDLIWKANWTAVKFIYLWTRYYGLLAFALELWLFNAQFTAEQCKPLHYLLSLLVMWVSLGTEGIIAMRTYAFLGRQRWLGLSLVLMLLGETGFLLFVSAGHVMQNILPIVTRGPCTGTDYPGQHLVSGIYLAPVIFDCICTALSLWQVTTLHTRGSRLVRVFVREGLFYFLLVSTGNLLNVIFMFQSNVNIQAINCFLNLVLSQVLCCRLVLNLRRQALSGDVHTSEQHVPSLGTIGNAPRPVTDTVNTVNIPLDRFGKGRQWSDAGSEENGVKVHVTVERDVDHER